MSQMINDRRIFFLGIFIFLIPFMGLPTLWKTLLINFSGILLIFSAVSFSLPKKPIKPKAKKEKKTVTLENIPVYPKDNLISQNNREIE